MDTVPLSPLTRQHLNRLFSPEDLPEAEELLITRCGKTLPSLEHCDMFDLERFRFAAMKISRGNLAGLRLAVDLAQRDWRDLLMVAGFGEDVTAHRRWTPVDQTSRDV